MSEQQHGPAPHTGDPTIDAAAGQLAEASAHEELTAAELDGVLAAGEHVHQTLTSRLDDLGS